MHVINITVDAQRHASAPRGAGIRCNNSDQIITFDIDAASGFDLSAPITAIFVTCRGALPGIEFSAGEVEAPVLTYKDGSLVYVGLTQGDIKTSSPAKLDILRSIYSEAHGHEADPDPGDSSLPIVTTVTLDDLVRISDVEHGRQVLITLENLSAVIGGSSTAVLYTEQELTAAQQEQARENIGAGTDTTFDLEVRQNWDGDTPLDTYRVTTPYADFEAAYAAGDHIRVHIVDVDNNIYLSNLYEYIGYYIAAGVIPLRQTGAAGATVVFYANVENDDWSDMAVNYTAYPTFAALSGAVTTLAEQIGAKYSKPPDGIPKSDLDSSVQSSLEKADTALQTAPVTSVNNQTGAVNIAVPSASSSNPLVDGTASAGSSTDYARADHVHPTDTSRAAATDLAAKADKPKYTTLTLAVADWETSGNAYACSKTVTGMTATSIVWLSYSDTQTEFSEAQSANTLTFTVADLPSAAITVNVAFTEGVSL